MLTIKIVSISLLVAMFLSTNVEAAKKTRSCDAELRVDLNARGNFPVEGGYVMERFSASGRESTANSARREARKNARQCGGITWQERWDTIPPNSPQIYSQCESGNRVSDFERGNIKCAIHDAVCTLKQYQGRSPSTKDYATIYLVTTGQTSSCGSVHRYSKNYGVTSCSSAERVKVCGNLPLQTQDF